MTTLGRFAWPFAIGMMALIGAQQAPAAVIYDGGAPDQATVYYADRSYLYSEAGVPFTLTAGANTITDVHWWGACTLGSCPAGDFIVSFYNDDSGAPGTLVNSYSVGNAGQTLTGGSVVGNFFDEYSYGTTITGLTLNAGVQYWLGISNDTGGHDWGMETTGAGTHYQRSSGAWASQSDALAFNLTGDAVPVPEPASLALLGLGLGAGVLVRRGRKVRRV